jgi:PAS domain S-box-containing protein
VTESAKSKNDVPLETSIPGGAVSLESILCTEELHRRPWRAPDHGRENRALVALVSALADSPGTILQTLAEEVLEVLQADSAGLSLLTNDEKRFYWAAIAGAWQPHIGGGTPRDFGPCGDVLDGNMPMLFTHWERRYPYLQSATPLAEEGLLVPFYVNGKAVGTIWAIAHHNRRKFDAEDLRLLESLSRFASTAYQAVASIDDLKFQIAEREKAETALQELAKGLEAKVRRLVDSNIIGIFIWGLDGRIIDANEAFLRVVGYDCEDLLSGRVSWRELTPDEWQASKERALAQLAATGVCDPFENEFFRKDGSRVPILLGAALFEEGRDEGVAFVLDLTERKLVAEEALRTSEERWRAVFDNSAIGVALTDLSGRLLATNSAYQKMLGYTEEEFGKVTFLELTHEDYREANWKLITELLEGKRKQFQIEKQYWRKDGSLIWVSNNVSLVPGTKSMPRFIMALSEDITARKQAEEAARASERRYHEVEMAHANRIATIGQLSASIAHEVNQPLASVVTSASACLRWLDTQKLDEARRSATRAMEEGHRASEIIGRIRALAKKAPPQKDWLDVNETIHDVIALARSEIQRNGVALETDLSEHVPLVLADRVELQQVILNLMMNAVEAMSGVSDGPRELLVRSGTDESEQVMISVQDSGPGIDPENLDHLFKAFYTTKPQGLGMGLAISRSIIEAHGGRLWATVNAPRGAVFQFVLPVGREQVA